MSTYEKMSLLYQEPHLHGGEVSRSVKLEHDLHISTGETLIVPAHIVVPRQHVVDVTVCEIVQTTHSISQLTQALSHTEKNTDKR